MSKVRILQLIPSLDQAGAEKQLSLLVRNLDREIFEVHVGVLTRLGPLEAELRQADIPIHFIGKKWRADPRAYFRLVHLLRELRPQILHTWLFAANSFGRLAAMRCGVPVVIASERCVDLWKASWQFALDRWLSRFTHAIVVNSSGVKEFYVSRGLPEAKIHVIPNAVPVMDKEPQRSKAELLRELGLPAEVRLIATVGRLWPQKRLEDAIWAADLLKVIRADVHLLIFGDGPERERLLRFREKVRIEDRVHFLGHRNDVHDWLPHVEVFWSTSGYEGQSNAILEAMANGLPVVATDIPGTRDLVIHGQTGLLFPVGDRAALARLTQRLLEDPELAKRLGGQAREYGATHFRVEVMVERFTKLYKEFLGRLDGGS